MIELKSFSTIALGAFSFVALPNEHPHMLRNALALGWRDSVEVLERIDVPSDSADFVGFLEHLMLDAERDLLGTQIICTVDPEGFSLIAPVTSPMF